MAEGRWTERDDKLALSSHALAEVRAALGTDAAAKWTDLTQKRFPLVVLGLDPDDADVRARMSRADALNSAVIAVAYGLPVAARLDASRARSELLWRVLRDGQPELLGKGPFPLVADPGVVGTFLLARLAGSREAQLAAITADLAARALAEAPGPDQPLRRRLVLLGCRPSLAEDFAERVRGVLRRGSEPRVPIAEVYDRYAQRYADAGALAAFKERLVGAARQRRIELGALTLPEHLPPDVRERSATMWGAERMHFVVAGWP